MPYRTITGVNSVAAGSGGRKTCANGERRSFEKAQATMTKVVRMVKKFGGPGPA